MFQIQEHAISYLYNQDLLLKEKEKEIKDKNDQIDRSSFPTSLFSLPQPLQIEIQKNAKLQDQLPAIIELYRKFLAYPLFSLPTFIEKMTLSMQKVKNESAFKSYFQKTLHNLWDNQQTNSYIPPSPPPKPKPASDVPIWIVRQDEKEKLNVQEEEELAPLDKRQEVDRLMKELDELCHKW